MKEAAKRRFLVPEVVQTSAMDCGPASLKCLLAGFGVSASYGRLREACQTDVDGTSIDTIEEIAIQLGLDAEQTMVPVDHLLLAEAESLPAIVVVRLPNGFIHFVVAWRCHGNRLVQVMDPATGRRWPTVSQFLSSVYVHTFPIPAADWRQWTGSAGFLNPLRRRLNNLGIAGDDADRLTTAALADPEWRALARLDAATRLVASVVRAGGIGRGRQATRLLDSFIDREQQAAGRDEEFIPATYWSVAPAPSNSSGDEQLHLRGAVLVRVRGYQGAQTDPVTQASLPQLSPELLAALKEPPTRLWRDLLRFLHADSRLAPGLFIPALALFAGGVVVETLLFRGLIDMAQTLNLASQRQGAIAAILIFVMALLLLRLHVIAGVLRLGRQLEIHLRIAFLEKIPRLRDQYFYSRPNSDMAQRSHSIHHLRRLPNLAAAFLRASFTLILTTLAIIWLSPANTFLALATAALALGLPLLLQPLLFERDMRARTHVGALGRFYLDALLGLVAIRTHRSERAVRREHESLLVEWAKSACTLYRAVVAIEGGQLLLAFLLAIYLIFNHLRQGDDTGSILLLLYWVLALSNLGQEIGLYARQYPGHRNLALRLLEPLGAPEDEALLADSADKQTNVTDRHSDDEVPANGVCICMTGVSIRAAGRTILEDINLKIQSGSHVAIVGPSGAGKSSLVGLLLGWHRPASGQLLVDELPLTGERLTKLRRAMAWVDPVVQLWNRSFLENLCYDVPADPAQPMDRVIEQADLLRVLSKLPNGLQTWLGEGGGLVSGGEGQRIRLGRAMLRTGVRLAILDEPFRGLDREQRRQLLGRARELWQDATLLCITHDVSETQGFERVLVMEGGRLVEDGVPAVLAGQPNSRYRAMLAAETESKRELWSSCIWRKLRLERGQLTQVEKT